MSWPRIAESIWNKPVYGTSPIGARHEIASPPAYAERNALALDAERRVLKRQRIEQAEREGRLRPATSRCGPWIQDEDGRSECVRCGEVDYPLPDDGLGP